MIVGALLASGIVALVVVWTRTMAGFSIQATGFNAQDEHYLAVLHNPCAHDETLDTTRCRSWGQGRWLWPDDQTLVKDAHDVCATESAAPMDAKIRTGASLLAARHPDYFDLQVGLEEVAARNIYCRTSFPAPQS